MLGTISRVSIDGICQKRGFVLSLGVVIAIAVDSGKVLDYAISHMDVVKNTDHER